MLFTRCPGCQTTFRISIDTLRVAHGAVRCGHCTTVFSAYTGLRQDAVEDAPRDDDEFLSPTLQTQELAGIEDIAGPEIESQSRPDELDEASEEAQDPDTPEIERRDEPARSEPILDESIEIDTPPLSADAAGGAPADTPYEDAPIEFEVTTSDDTEHREADDPVEPVTAEGSSTKLHFEAPVDEWALLLSEIERSVDENTAEREHAAAEGRDDEADSVAASPPDSDEEPELWNIGEPFSLDAYDDTAERRKLGKLEPRGAQSRADERVEEPDFDDDGARVDAPISAEEIDATLSAEPDPQIVAVLEGGLDRRPEPRRTRLWAFGCVALSIALGIQALHHFRAPLATQPAIGTALQSIYGLLGIDLVPEWDLEQYEITNWAATAGSGTGGPGNLHITAEIRNRGPQDQPYPSILLELKDRWEAVIGSRVFTPSEYLATSPDASSLMAAGSSVPADLTVVDPGLDASGFELDVCLEVDTGRMSCSTDRVFE